MNARASRSDSDREIQFIAEVLRAQLPPARPTADPAALWAIGRHARRISTEAKISLVVTAAQVVAMLGVLGVLVSFVDWRRAAAASADALRASSYPGIGLAIVLVAIAAACVARLVVVRRQSAH